MATFETYQAAIAKAQYVAEVNAVLSPMGRSPQERDLAVSLFDDLVSGDFSALHGSADEWYNLATAAGRAGHVAAEHRVLEVALLANPEDVDLLCALLQLRYIHGNIADALALFQRIEALGEKKTAPFWRYWAYGAVFLARYMKDKAQAEQFLDRGRNHVVPAELYSIFRQYRRVLIDGATAPSAESDSSVYDYAELAARVEARYREGLDLGIENGYVLATELAVLLRERSAGKSPAEADHILDEALAFLDVAERTYTHSVNHPVEEIYQERAITLMARRRYADALQIFRSLPSYRLDESFKVMARYAANMTGQTFDESAAGGGTGVTQELSARVSRLEAAMAQILELLGQARGTGE